MTLVLTVTVTVTVMKKLMMQFDNDDDNANDDDDDNDNGFLNERDQTRYLHVPELDETYRPHFQRSRLAGWRASWPGVIVVTSNQVTPKSRPPYRPNKP